MMRQSVLDIQRVEVVAFEPKTITATLGIIFTHDGKQERIQRPFVLVNADEITEAIIREVKAAGKAEPEESDDFLGSLFVVSFPREDEVFERMVGHVAKLCEKARMLKHMRTHQEYMKLFDEIKIVKFSV